MKDSQIIQDKDWKSVVLSGEKDAERWLEGCNEGQLL